MASSEPHGATLFAVFSIKGFASGHFVKFFCLFSMTLSGSVSDSSFEAIVKDKQDKEGDRFCGKTTNINYSLIVLITAEGLWILKITFYSFPESALIKL